MHGGSRWPLSVQRPGTYSWYRGMYPTKSLGPTFKHTTTTRRKIPHGHDAACVAGRAQGKEPRGAGIGSRRKGSGQHRTLGCWDCALLVPGEEAFIFAAPLERNGPRKAAPAERGLHADAGSPGMGSLVEGCGRP